jgi:uncharacterized protein
VRWLWLSLGCLCVGLGFLGAILPIMPSTVFFIAAAACFARSSPRLEAWVLNLPGIGPMVREYRAGLGMPRQIKVLVVALIIVACGISIWRVPPLIAKIGVTALGAVGVWFIVARVPTKEQVQAARNQSHDMH